ncbi:unnamed protein product [Merluccius merluccius]
MHSIHSFNPILAMLFTYIILMVFRNMPHSTGTILQSDIKHLIAQGSYRKKGCASLPKTVWNLLQQTTDHSMNPILCPRNHTRPLPYRGTNLSYESLLAEGPSGVQGPVHEHSYLAGLPAGFQEFVRHMHKRDYPRPDGAVPRMQRRRQGR